ncbi:ABC transporter ATP-binding protein [Chitinophaga nivalis]|uniref:ABC transporter ATP-binding protein n=1 Tax=Chitinophaga nivalis TaxID=2991709 RepID=A0ABT3INI8_9BACT|nr:ABC transporter ATP-binding protein [Chitinophaga nivalis]MCW3464790.1 ABC transporter ATP-binding protein [Chitinophaga nivalis]MCW3485519.1 ABC transporter ATP-binding protein [Chitinophaga nivalis]
MNIEVDHISVTINKKCIIAAICLTVEPRQFVGILGANGSGKSTLLKSITKIIQPDSGSIRINDRCISQVSYAELAQQIAVVGQFNSMDVDYTVTEFVMMGRYPHKKKYESMTAVDHALVKQALHELGMSDYANRKVMGLSGGEKQRIVIARAIAQQTPCLILDEPTNHMDIKHQLQLFTMLKAMEKTVITAIHDMALAYNYCDKLYALKDGRLLLSGRPEEVITKENVKQLFGIDIALLRCEKENKVAVLYEG